MTVTVTFVAHDNAQIGHDGLHPTPRGASIVQPAPNTMRGQHRTACTQHHEGPASYGLHSTPRGASIVRPALNTTRGLHPTPRGTSIVRPAPNTTRGQHRTACTQHHEGPASYGLHPTPRGACTQHHEGPASWPATQAGTWRASSGRNIGRPRHQQASRGRNSSVGSVLGWLSCLMQRRGFHPPLNLR